MRVFLGLALRNLARHPWRSFATVLGVAIGIAAVLASLSVGENVEANIRSSLEAAAGGAELLVTPGAQGRAVFTVDEAAAGVAGTPGVEAVLPVLNFRAEPVRELAEGAGSVLPGVDSGFQLSGRVTDDPALVPARLLEGSLPVPGSQGIALASGFASNRDIATGDELRFATQFGEVPFTVTGILDDGYGLASTNGGRVGIVALEDLQSALRLTGRASYLELHLAPDALVEEVREQLAERLGDEYAVTFPAGSGNIATGIVETIQAGLTVLAVTLLALGGFMAYNTFAASVVERTREYALLRTLCCTRGQVHRLALIEAVWISLLGVLVGVLLGVALSYLITRANALSFGVEFRTLVLPLRSVLAASAVGVVVALLAGLLPARHASRTPPLASLRKVDEVGEPARSNALGWILLAAGVAIALLPWPGSWALGAAGVAMALLFLGLALAAPTLLRPALALFGPLMARLFGAPGRLGSSFAQRNASRNGVAIGTVVVGMGLTIGVGSMVGGINHAIARWVDTTVVGDLFVTSPVSFPEDFEERAAAAVPDLDAVSGVGIRVVRFQPGSGNRGRSIALVLVDPERFHPETGFGRFQYMPEQGNAERGYQALAAGGRVLVANTLRDRFGVEVGDSIELRTSEGFREFPVEGVVVDFTGGGEAAVASIGDLDLFGGGTPDLYVMTVRDGASPESARAALLEAFPELHLEVTLNRNYREQILALTRQSFASTNALLALAVFIAALGVANTLGMNLSGRSHEVGILRTLGLTRGGVAMMVAAEGLVVLVVGTLLGIACGLLLSHVITAGAAALTGFAITPRYPWHLIVAAVLAAPVVGLLASLLPARRAARLPPVMALGGLE